MSYDVVIVGGGIVGLATAWALRDPQHPLSQASLLVIEAEKSVARHQTGNNSGVIHSGLYYPPGSLKAKNCVSGSRAMYEFCQQHDIAHEQCGKLVVATKEDELPRLDKLAERGEANGLKDIRRLSAAEIPDYEPHAAGLAALHVPQTGIINYRQVAENLVELIEASGGTVRTDWQLRSVKQRDKEIILGSSTAETKTKFLINCAGLQSDRVARLCGLRPAMRIVPIRGEYYELCPERRDLVRNLIYPVPDPSFPFLGVHFTRMIGGGIEAGPNAVLAWSRRGYSRGKVSPRDALEMLSYPGLWRMALGNATMGLGETYRSWSQKAFVRALAKLVPEIQPGDVVRAGAGVRAQAVASDGKLIDDFHIEQAPGMVHVLNAPSPAATSSLSIGQTIADLVTKQLQDA